MFMTTCVAGKLPPGEIGKPNIVMVSIVGGAATAVDADVDEGERHRVSVRGPRPG